VRHLITPGNVVASLAGNAFARAKHSGPKVVVGADATLPPTGRRPSLFVMVVGETARARNFSLNGYERATNPELGARPVVNFPKATACGTSTEVSLPCMFSPFGRANYDEGKIQSHESVLHVLARAGVQVLWRDNQSGCKGVCDGLAAEQMDAANVPGLCAGGQCFDEVLLHGMDKVVRDGKGNMLVVMHQLGSHGPSYYRRYPPEFKRFTPACENDDLRQCSTEQIVNAYDNTILYTDHVLGKVIDFLQAAQATHDTAMLYVSDHGESLGEGGLYLHGVPFAIAPEVQTHVPFVLWTSPAWRAAHGVDEACMKAVAAQPVSHDWLFHSLLGAFEVRTQAYDRSLDVFGNCRAPAMQAGPRK
jgi:lipid A ethanolaminephosphotransferase